VAEDWAAAEVVDIIRASTVAGCPSNISDAKIMVLQMEDYHVGRIGERAAIPTRTNRAVELCEK